MLAHSNQQNDLDKAFEYRKSIENDLLKIASHFLNNNIVPNSSTSRTYIDDLRFRMSDKLSRSYFIGSLK